MLSQWGGCRRRSCLAVACRCGTAAFKHRFVICCKLPSCGLGAAIDSTVGSIIRVVIDICRMVVLMLMVSRRVVRPKHHLVLACLVRGRQRGAASCIIRLVLLVHQVGALVGDCA